MLTLLFKGQGQILRFHVTNCSLHISYIYVLLSLLIAFTLQKALESFLQSPVSGYSYFHSLYLSFMYLPFLRYHYNNGLISSLDSLACQIPKLKKVGTDYK